MKTAQAAQNAALYALPTYTGNKYPPGMSQSGKIRQRKTVRVNKLKSKNIQGKSRNKSSDYKGLKEKRKKAAMKKGMPKPKGGAKNNLAVDDAKGNGGNGGNKSNKKSGKKKETMNGSNGGNNSNNNDKKKKEETNGGKNKKNGKNGKSGKNGKNGKKGNETKNTNGNNNNNNGNGRKNGKKKKMKE